MLLSLELPSLSRPVSKSVSSSGFLRSLSSETSWLGHDPLLETANYFPPRFKLFDILLPWLVAFSRVKKIKIFFIHYKSKRLISLQNVADT